MNSTTNDSKNRHNPLTLVLLLVLTAIQVLLSLQLLVLKLG